MEYLEKHPTLLTAEVMKLAGFSEEETKNRSTQKLVHRKLPDKSKTNRVSFASDSTVDGAGGFAISYNGKVYTEYFPTHPGDIGDIIINRSNSKNKNTMAQLAAKTG